MKISQIIRRYMEIKKIILRLNKNFDFKDYDQFFNCLKKVEGISVNEFEQMIDKFEQTVQIDTVVMTEQLEESNNIYSDFINTVDFNNVNLTEIENMEENDSLNKEQLLTLAHKIGITKKFFKNKKDLYQEIKRHISNRDVLINIENTLKPFSST